MLLNRPNPHGGDIYKNRVKLDFSANVNPAGMPEAVRDALIRSADRASVYPDPSCSALREAVGAAEGVSPDEILCGCGAAELIYSYAYALMPDRGMPALPALLVSPTFSEYRTALEAAGIGAEDYFLKESDGFRLTEEILGLDFSRYSALFLCSPNNPTGLAVPPSLVRKLAETGIRMFLDCCFLDLTDDPERYGLPALIRDFPNLTVLRAFTKSYAMAGVRLGYALSSDAAFLTVMSGKAPCWNVSTMAQEAGIAAAGCGSWLRESVKTITRERTRLYDALTGLGLFVVPGEANFLLIRAGRGIGSGRADDLPRRLLCAGILVRDCSNYIGLGPGWFRIAVRTPEENDALLTAVGEELS